jgi:hypothetical protein
MIQAKFGLNGPSGFRGEEFWKKIGQFSYNLINIIFSNMYIP